MDMNISLRRITVIIMLIFSLTAGLYQLSFASERPLGDLGKPDDYYENIKSFKWSFPDTAEFQEFIEELPKSFDWRNEGAVTPAKNQGSCGSCWAFAMTGAFESKILIREGIQYDLSEQQLVSCSDFDCNGGTSNAIRFWFNEGPMEESCTGYGDIDFDDEPTGRSVNCGELQHCGRLQYNTKTDYTVDTDDINEVKSSLYKDGPAYFRFDVWQDFDFFWENGGQGEVYIQADQSSDHWWGGHAVLIIGWDDDRGAWLCKNSWGETGGPNGDGTFWVAYTGHAGGTTWFGGERNGLELGMTNFKITGSPEPKKPIADAGTDQTVREGDTVTLDGSGSRDLDDGIVSYSWQQTAGINVTLSDSGAIQPIFFAPDIDTIGESLTFKLTVTDNGGLENSDTCIVYILPKESPVLSVTPEGHTVDSESGTVTFEVANTGTGTMNWSASVSQGWLRIDIGGSGTNNGTITVSYETNTGNNRTGTIIIQAENASGTPKNVNIYQNSGKPLDYMFERMFPYNEQPYDYILSKYDHVIAADQNGTMYIADGDNIWKLNSEGEYIAKWEIKSLGMTIDKDGYIYVTDSNDRIKKYNADGNIIASWGSTGTEDGEFCLPSGIVVDADGNMYIADGGNDRIQKISSEGNFITKWECMNLGPYSCNFSSGGHSKSWSPNSTVLNVHGENVYVIDMDDTIIKFSSEGLLISEWNLKTEGLIEYLDGLAIDDNGEIYISSANFNDKSKHGILKLDSDGNIVKQIYDEEYFDVFLTIGLDGNIYAIGSYPDQIMKLNLDGEVLARWGTYSEEHGTFDEPEGISIDNEGNIYVLDGGNGRIEKFNSDGVYISGINVSCCINNAIATDTSGNIYLADAVNDIVKKFNNEGKLIAEWGNEVSGNGEFNFGFYGGIAIDNSGNVYVSENDQILKFTSDGIFITKWVVDDPRSLAVDSGGKVYVIKSGYKELQIFSSDGVHVGGWDIGGYANGIAIDESDNIYITYLEGDCVKKFTQDGQFLTQFGESGFLKGQFNNPSYLAVGKDGRVYITDSDNNRVQVFVEADVSNKKMWASPTQQNYGTMNFSDTDKPSQTFTITNISTENQTISSISITGANRTEFIQQNDSCLNTPISPSQICTFDVVFSPTSPGKKQANVEIFSGSDTTILIPLSGKVVDYSWDISPASCDFGDLNLGESSSQVLTITNTGNVEFSLDNIFLSYESDLDFSLSKDNCWNKILSPSETCTLDIGFSPTYSGDSNGEIVISSEDSSQLILNVALKGTGIYTPQPPSPEPTPTDDNDGGGGGCFISSTSPEKY